MKDSPEKNLLRELQGQLQRIQANKDEVAKHLAGLEGQEEEIRHLEARLRGGMLQGFERIGMEQLEGKS